MVFKGGERVTYVGYKPITYGNLSIVSRGMKGVVISTKNSDTENDLFTLVPVSFDNNLICLQVSSLNLRSETLTEEDDFRTIFDKMFD